MEGNIWQILLLLCSKTEQRKFFCHYIPFVSTNGKIILCGRIRQALRAGVKINHFAALGEVGAEFS